MILKRVYCEVFVYERVLVELNKGIVIKWDFREKIYYVNCFRCYVY